MRTRTGADMGALIIASIAGILLAVGSFGAWATWGPFTANGLQGGRDGWVTLVIAALVGITLWRYYLRPRWTQAAALTILGLCAVGVGAFDAQDIAGTQVQVLGQTVGPEVGWGIWVVIVAGGVLTLAGVALGLDQRRRRTSEAPAGAEASRSV